MLKDVFLSAEHQEKPISGLGYELTLKSNKVDAVIEEAAGVADARNEIDRIHWYVAHYTHSMQQ